MHTQNDIHIITQQVPLVYNNMGWLGDSSHRGQGR